MREGECDSPEAGGGRIAFANVPGGGGKMGLSGPAALLTDFVSNISYRRLGVSFGVVRLRREGDSRFFFFLPFRPDGRRRRRRRRPAGVIDRIGSSMKKRTTRGEARRGVAWRGEGLKSMTW